MAGPRSTKTEEAPAPEPTPVVLERGASLPLNVTVLRIVGAYVHLDVLGTPVVVLASKVRAAIATD
jgi:hypothetical protein